MSRFSRIEKSVSVVEEFVGRATNRQYTAVKLARRFSAGRGVLVGHQ